MKMIYFSFHTLFILALYLSFFVSAIEDQYTPEDLFRSAVSSWQASGRHNYKAFHSLAEDLEKQFQSSLTRRLEIVGAIEEGILIIERFIFQEQQGREDASRDQTLSKLYTVYATILSELTDIECVSLALDPHTLLIGADTVKPKGDPSTKLCVENADNSARNAATLDATNQKAEALLKKINAGNVHERKPKEFVAELFDSFADSFDQKLLLNLQYRVPELVGKLANELLQKQRQYKEKFRNALDAGSGTGLAGRYLRQLVSSKLIGVDASQKMLNVAAKCSLTSGCGLEEKTGEIQDDHPLYDDLIQMDLEEMTVRNTLFRVSFDNELSQRAEEGFDLIVAADVLVYFGSLENLIETFANVSQEGAILVFSCEKASSEEAPLGWRLLPSGRFAHTKQHAIEIAEKKGYTLEYYEDIVPRMEKGEPVKGHLFGFSFSKSIEEAEL
jgi:predicted TPR repeat methyltransferase